MGSSERPSHSSTARSLVVTKLEARCRLRIRMEGRGGWISPGLHAEIVFKRHRLLWHPGYVPNQDIRRRSIPRRVELPSISSVSVDAFWVDLRVCGDACWEYPSGWRFSAYLLLSGDFLRLMLLCGSGCGSLRSTALGSTLSGHLR